MDRRRMRSGTALALAVAWTAGLVGGTVAQGDDTTGPGVPMYKGTPGRTGETAGPAPGAPVGTLWSVATQGPIKSSPAVVGDRMVIVAGDTHLMALEVATGAQAWTSADDRYVGSPAVSDGLVYSATEDGAVSALSVVDGTLRWRTPGTLNPLAAPLVVGDLVVVGGVDGTLRALDAASGAERWSKHLGGEVTTRGPATDGVRAFVGTSDGYLNAVDLASGELAWAWPFPTGCCATVAVRDGLVVAAGSGEDETGLLVAFDSITGDERWRFVPEDGSGLRSPSMDATSVYVKAAAGTMVALAVADGSVRWTAPIEPHETPIVIAGDTLVVVGPADTVTAVDAATGAMGWTASLGGEVTGGIAVVGGRVLAGNATGAIVALGSGETIAPSPAADVPGQARLLRTVQPPDGFEQAVDIAFDGQGNAWVTEGATGTIAIFSPEGDFIERWGAPGSADGQFDFSLPGSADPSGSIAFLPDGGFWITDPGNHRIQRFDVDREWVASVGHFGDGDGQFLGQIYLTRGPGGDLYVGDGKRGVIQVFSEDGAYVRTISVTEPSSIIGYQWAVVVAGDRIFVPLDTEVRVLELDGTPVGSIRSPLMSGATDAFLSPDGLIHIADWDEVLHVIDPATLSVVGSWQVLHDGAVAEPTAVGVSPAGDVWAVLWEIDVIDIVELPGLAAESSGPATATLVRALSAPGGLDKPVDVAFDAAGNGWVTEGEGGTIAIFSPEGDFIERWGSPGSANGQFDFSVTGSNDPTGSIAFLPDGGFWITDPGNHRIQRFDAERAWVASIGHFGRGDGQFAGQTQLTVASDGRLFVQDGERNDIQVFDPDGRYLDAIATLGTGAAAMVDPVAPLIVGDRLLFVDGAPLWNTVHVMDLDGEPIGTITEPSYLNLADLALGPDGMVVAADWGKAIHVIDPAAMRPVATWQVLHDGSPTSVDGLGVAPDGRVWAAQWSIGAVEILELPVR